MAFLIRRTPTVDLYFLHPLRKWVRMHPFQQDDRPVRPLGPNSFIHGRRVVIIRYATSQELEAIERIRPERCAYLIDDDIPAACEDSHLPPDYRHRLEGFLNGSWLRIRNLADTVIAPNARIFAAYPDREHVRMHPASLGADRSFSHFRGRTLDIVFAGTRSHLADLEGMAEVIEEIVRQHRHVRLFTFLGRHAPERLRRLPRTRHFRPRSWWIYRRMMRHMRFHVGIAPMRATPFNLARSINKLHDHAAFGAAGLYSDLPVFRENLTDGEHGRLLPWDAQAWWKALQQVVSDPSLARRMAEKGAERSLELGDPERLCRWWLKWFGLGSELETCA